MEAKNRPFIFSVDYDEVHYVLSEKEYAQYLPAVEKFIEFLNAVAPAEAKPDTIAIALVNERELNQLKKSTDEITCYSTTEACEKLRSIYEDNSQYASGIVQGKGNLYRISLNDLLQENYLQHTGAVQHEVRHVVRRDSLLTGPLKKIITLAGFASALSMQDRSYNLAVKIRDTDYPPASSELLDLVERAHASTVPSAQSLLASPHAAYTNPESMVQDHQKFPGKHRALVDHVASLFPLAELEDVYQNMKVAADSGPFTIPDKTKKQLREITCLKEPLERFCFIYGRAAEWDCDSAAQTAEEKRNLGIFLEKGEARKKELLKILTQGATRNGSLLEYFIENLILSDEEKSVHPPTRLRIEKLRQSDAASALPSTFADRVTNRESSHQKPDLFKR